jgi:hypothetical protein
MLLKNRFLIAVLFTLPILAIGSPAAPTRFHNHSTGNFSANVCGIPVDATFSNVDNFFLFADGSSKDTFSFTVTFTNPVNGKAVTASMAGQVVNQAIVNEQANTVTFITTFKGLPEKIQTPHGPVLSRDAGFITFTATFDLTTGDLISTATTVNNGPHPEADSDFALFCEVITDALM